MIAFFDIFFGIFTNIKFHEIFNIKEQIKDRSFFVSSSVLDKGELLIFVVE